MINVSKSLPDIAVLRGGTKEFKKSLADGGEVLSSLSKIGYQPLDVLITDNGAWTVRGRPTDAHEIFSRSHTIIDTTREINKDYHDLARRMGIPLMLSKDHNMTLSREDMYRILRQQGIRVPDTITIRANEQLKDSDLRDIWSTYHTPLIVRPLYRNESAPSKLIRMFQDLENIVRDYHGRGIDVHVMTYRRVPTSSIAVLPNFHGQELYTPLWVDTFAGINEIPNSSANMSAHHQAPQFRKDQVREFVTTAYDALGLTGPACIDIIEHNNSYIVVNVDPAPSFRKDSRFTKSLESVGSSIGQYIHSHIVNSI